MKEIPGWFPAAMLWGGIVVIALSDAPIYMVAGALMSCFGMNLATENDYKRRLDAMERHFGERIYELERQVGNRFVDIDDVVARFREERRTAPE
jgi:hypothetical protein